MVIPTPQEKHMVMKAYARSHECYVFFETGTARGETAEAMANAGHFRQLYSCEIDKHQYWYSAIRLEHLKNLRVFYGDSAEILHRMMPLIRDRTLFWLDAHENGHDEKSDSACPVMEELYLILENREPLGHVILVDDARLFGVDRDYPEIDEVFAYAALFGYSGFVDNDVIRLIPGE